MSTGPHRGMALVATLLGFFIVMLDTTIVNVALVEIGTDLDTTVASLQWVVDAYTLVFAAFLLTAGAACDRLGARKVYLAGLLVFAVLSAVCALAPTGGFLVAGRVFQGLGAAAIVPGSLALAISRLRRPEGTGTGHRPVGWGRWSCGRDRPYSGRNSCVCHRLARSVLG